MRYSRITSTMYRSKPQHKTLIAHNSTKLTVFLIEVLIQTLQEISYYNSKAIITNKFLKVKMLT